MTDHKADPGPHTCETVLVEAGERCTICGVLCDPYETRGLAKLVAETPLEDQGGDLEARVIGAIIARPWLVGHCGDLVAANFVDERNRATIIAIRGVQSTHGTLPTTTADMARAIMRRIEGTPAADRVDLPYLASMVTIAELALGTMPTWTGQIGHLHDHVIDWFDGAIDDLLARRAA